MKKILLLNVGILLMTILNAQTRKEEVKAGTIHIKKPPENKKEIKGQTELSRKGLSLSEIGYQRNNIFTIVEQMPVFSGGETGLFNFLKENIKFPEMAKDSGISGIVYVTFVVLQTGKISEIKVLRGIGGGCDDEAIRVIKLMPDWIPGAQNGRSVDVQFNLPVRFILK